MVAGIQNTKGKAALDTEWQALCTGRSHRKMIEAEGWHSQRRALRGLTWLRRAKPGRSRFNETASGH